MNGNYQQDENGRLLAVIDDSTITLNVQTAVDQTVSVEIAHPIADLGGQDAVVVAVAQGSLEISNTVDVEVQNFPADPASGTNQITTIEKLDDVLTKLNGGLPNALINGLLGVQEANSTLIFSDTNAIRTSTASLDTKTLSPLGTVFSVAAVSVAASAGQLPDQAYGRGFSIQNLDSSTPVYVGPANTVTSSNGWRIAAGEKEVFNLPNSNLLYAISGTGTVSIRIGAVA